MKTIITLFICLVFSNQIAFSQSVCRSQLLNYTGPHNTSELIVKLNSTNNSIINSLTSTLKQALINHTVFDNGYPRGIDSNDVEINTLYQSGSAGAVLSAIFGCPVVMCSYTTKPIISTMSLSSFLALYNSNPVQYAYTPFISACYNCYFGKNDVCCYVGGNGCYDIAIEFVKTGEHIYVVQE